MSYFSDYRVPCPRLRGHESIYPYAKHAHDKRGHGTGRLSSIIKPRRAPTEGWSVATRSFSQSLVGVMIFALLLLSSGCSHKTDNTQTPSTEKNPARSTIERGPVKVTAEIQPSKAMLSDEPKLTLTIDYEKGVQIEKPPFGSSLGNFTIRDFREPLAKTRDGREILQQVYTLEPMQTGKLFIDPISVTFIDLRPNGDEKTHTIQTEALMVEITSMLAGNAPSLENLRPAADPLYLPSSGAVLVWLIIFFCVILSAAAWWFLRRIKREKALTEVVLSPEELARLELEKLAQSGLAETDVKQFFVEITAIVRRYIERTTGIRAPELTTEEFLREISLANTFDRQTNERLRNFLESADLVKFAAHRPRAEDIEESFSRARIFIGIKSQESARQPREAAV